MLRARFAENDRIMNTLVLAPLVVLENWKREFELFSKIPKSSIVVLKGSVKKRISMVQAREGFPTIFITNYDVMNNKDLLNALLRHKIEISVLDEAHLIKNPQSTRAKAVVAIADSAYCKHRYLLSGTPILNNAMDLFMQYRAMDGYLDKFSTFGRNFFWFRNTYFEDKNASWSGNQNHFPDWQPRVSTYGVISDIIAKKMMVVKKKDVLTDLPDLTVEYRYALMSTDQKKVYKELKEDFIAYLDELDVSGEPKAVIAQLAITKALRLQQVVTGFVKTEDGEEIEIKKNPRLEILKDLLEEIAPNSKVIVWANFKFNYKQIASVCKDLGLGYTEGHGGVSAKNKQLNIDKFNNDVGCRVMIGNQASLGIGVNLVASNYSIYYSRDFKLGSDIQSEARNYRKGSEIHDKITRINIVSPGTIDELVCEALEKKQKISEEIIKWKKRL
jgi:SNF2 family DNA or RNA helicase